LISRRWCHVSQAPVIDIDADEDDEDEVYKEM